MKKLFILSAIAFGGLVYTTADAQPGVYAQGPAVEATPAYGNSDDVYYYLPDLGVYYDVTDQCYFYFDGTEWVSSPYLPGQYANYDWRSARRFEIIGFRPYLRDDFYRGRYNGNRFTNWGQGNYSDRFNNGYASRDTRGYNRQPDNNGNANRAYNSVNRGFNQQADNRAFNRPAQPYRPEGGQPGNRFKNQPSNPGNNRGADRGGAEHFAQNRAQNTAANRKMSKF